jgi:hypothetical protein
MQSGEQAFAIESHKFEMIDIDGEFENNSANDSANTERATSADNQPTLTNQGYAGSQTNSSERNAQSDALVSSVVKHANTTKLNKLRVVNKPKPVQKTKLQCEQCGRCCKSSSIIDRTVTHWEK